MFIEELDFSVILFGSPLLCGMMASFVDLDHFVAARSFTIHVSFGFLECSPMFLD